jgi:hypothetical protein
VAKGLVHFTRLSDNKAVDVAAGKYATAADGVELAMLAIPGKSGAVPQAIGSATLPKSAAVPVAEGNYPKPRKHLYGKVLFEDDFEALDNWEAVIETGKDSGRLEPMGAGWEKYVSVLSGRQGCNRIYEWQGSVGLNNPLHGRDTIKDRFVGIRSRKAIEAARFVIKIRSLLSGVRVRGSTWRDSGIEAGEVRSLVQREAIIIWAVGDFGLLEFEPAQGQNTQGTLLCQMFSVTGNEAGGEHIAWMESRYVYPVSKKIVFAALNGSIGVDKVVVRELLEEGAGTKAADIRH